MMHPTLAGLTAHRDQLAADLRKWDRDLCDALKLLIKAQDNLSANVNDPTLRSIVDREQQRVNEIDKARGNIQRRLMATQEAIDGLAP